MMMRKMLFLVALLPSLALAASGQMSGRPVGTDATPFTIRPSGASSSVPLAAHVSGWANAKSYGAKCDGATDDTAAISSMVTALGSTPTTVIVPGPVKVSSNITIPITAPVRFEGNGGFTGTGAVIYTPWVLAGYAPLASPALTGTPTAPTPTAADNSTTLATTAYVKAQGYAPLASPALTGTPTVPTAAADTNTTQAASTAYVIGQGSSTTPAMDGIAAAGTSTRFAHGDHVHPTDTSRAPLASPTFTGTVTAPTVTTSAASGSAAATIVAGSKVCLNGATCTEYLTSNAGGIPGAQAWQTPTLTNSWVAYGAPNASPGYYRDAVGIVHLQGWIKSGTITAAAFTLPAGYRPAASIWFTTSGYGASTCQINISSAGVVSVQAGSTSGSGLDGITFRAEQ